MGNAADKRTVTLAEFNEAVKIREVYIAQLRSELQLFGASHLSALQEQENAEERLKESLETIRKLKSDVRRLRCARKHTNSSTRTNIGIKYPVQKIPYVPNAVRDRPFTIRPVVR